MHTFIAYIDESGDDGLRRFRTPGGGGGASNWLILSACVVRASRRLSLVNWRDEIKEVTGKRSPGRSVHFADFNHGQKRAACGVIATKNLRFTSVICHKPSLDGATFTIKNQLYFYLCRYLVERVSWLCRDARPSVKEGDGRAKIVFSRRGGMSYPDFQEYLDRLRKSGDGSTVHWPIIDIHNIEAKDHSRDAGLQLADCGASAVASAFEPDPYGNVEGQYLQAIRRQIYHRNNNYLSYGMKLHPPKNQVQLTDQQASILREFM